MTCPNCGTDSPHGSFCSECGCALRCARCGNENIDQGDLTCCMCGSTISGVCCACAAPGVLSTDNYCAHCGAQQVPNDALSAKCLHPVGPAGSHACPACSGPVESADKHCISCGFRLLLDETTPAEVAR